jgi:hypothetical protein
MMIAAVSTIDDVRISLTNPNVVDLYGFLGQAVSCQSRDACRYSSNNSVYFL